MTEFKSCFYFAKILIFVLPFDTQYTLRLCGEHKLKRESVLLHGIIGQLNEATELALQVKLHAAYYYLGLMLLILQYDTIKICHINFFYILIRFIDWDIWWLFPGYCWIGLLNPDCNPIWWIGLWLTIQSQNWILDLDCQSSFAISIQIQNIRIILSWY